MKILVCDGDAGSRAVLRRLVMMSHGYDVVECGTGAEALELLADGTFDLLMIDTDLPVLGGFDTVALLREAGGLRELPVFFVTGDRTAGSVQRGIELGVSDYILKPVRVQRLMAGLKAVCAGAAGETRAHGAAPRLTIEAQTRVMLVDGDSDFRTFFEGLLAPYCHVVSVPSGAAALTAAWQAVPAMVFIGRGLGLLGPVALVRQLQRFGVGRFVKVAAAGDHDAGDGQVFDDVISRTLVAGVMLRQLKRFITQGGGPLHTLLEHVPDLRNILLKAAAGTFGMMLGAEVDAVEPGESDVVDAHAEVSMQVGASTRLHLELQCAADLTRQLAVGAFGDDVDAGTAVSVLGEVANVVSGRLQATVIERGERCTCSLPTYGVGRASRPEEDGADRLVLEMAPAGSTSRFRIVLTVTQAAAHSAAAQLEPARTA